MQFHLGSRSHFEIMNWICFSSIGWFSTSLSFLAKAEKPKLDQSLDVKRQDSVDRKELLSNGHQHGTTRTFTFGELAAATENFRADCLLGEGGFGRVYKGYLESINQVYFLFFSLSTIVSKWVSFSIQISRFSPIVANVNVWFILIYRRCKCKFRFILKYRRCKCKCSIYSHIQKINLVPFFFFLTKCIPPPLFMLLF